MSTQKKNKILIISTNAIGDAYLSMSAIELLENEYGNVDFTFIFPKSTRELNISKDTNYKILYASKSIVNFVLILTELFFHKYDFAFSFFPGRYNTFLLKLSKSKNKGGYFNYKKIERWDNQILIPTIYRQGEFEAAAKWSDSKNYLELIGNILRCFVPEVTVKKCKPFISDKVIYNSDTIIIHGISRNSDRSFTIAQFNTIVKFLDELSIKNIYILGSKKDNERIKENLNYSNVSYLSDLSLEKLVMQLSTSFLIATDSFPLHIADAYNTNFIGLFTSTKPEAVLTNVKKSIILKKDSFSEISVQEFEEELNKIKQYFLEHRFI